MSTPGLEPSESSRTTQPYEKAQDRAEVPLIPERIYRFKAIERVIGHGQGSGCGGISKKV